MIKQMKLHNFKAFEDLDIEFKPITLLLGPNNSGKSSIIAALRLLVQTIESNDSNVPILLNGIFGDFGTYKDAVHQNNVRRQIGISLTLIPYNGYIGERKDARGERWDYSELGSIGFELIYKYRSVRREVILKKSSLFRHEKQLLTTEYSDDSERQTISSIMGFEIPPSYKSSISKRIRFTNFLPRNIFYPLSENEGVVSDFLGNFSREDLREISRTSSSIYQQLLNIEYIGAMRVPPERTYLFTGERRRRIGASGERAGNILVMDSARKGARTSNILQNVSYWLKSAEIASKLEIDKISDRHFELKVEHPTTHEAQNIADVGYGNSQIIPVLVGGFNLSPGSIYMVEEPEIHLHPKAQSELGDFFLDLYQNGIQSIVETHSEYLVLRLQQHIAKGVISADHVRVYYIYANEDRKQAIPLEISSNGIFITDWPEGFFPERLSEAAKLAKIRFENKSNGD